MSGRFGAGSSHVQTPATVFEKVRPSPSLVLLGPTHQPAPVNRNVRPAVTATAPEVLGHGSLEIRVCVRTYRLFYVPYTEDFLLHVLSEDEKEMMRERKKELRERQKAWAKEVEAGEWSKGMMERNAEAAEAAAEEKASPGTGGIAEAEAELGPALNAEQSTGASAEMDMADRDVGANVAVAAAS